MLLAWSTRKSLTKWGYQCRIAGDLAEARKAIEESTPDLVILDIRLPDGSGLDLLRELSGDNRPKVIIASAYSEMKVVIEAMRRGASDFLSKPFDADALHDALARVLASAPVSKGNGTPETKAQGPDLSRFGVVAESPIMIPLAQRIQRFANTPRSTILISGETGTGKSMFGRAFHAMSARAKGPFVEVNCASIPHSLVESELMGHDRGAFTDAREAKGGLLEHADGGTLLLDEIGDMPLEMQAKLLEFIEMRTYRRLGSTRVRRSDVRIIAASHRDLKQLVAEDRFREDLYHRLKVLTLEIPPLRERPEDLARLIEHFLDVYSREMDITVDGISDSAFEHMRTYAWPGNIRELRHAIESAIVLCGSDSEIQSQHLPDEIQRRQAGVTASRNARPLDIATTPSTAGNPLATEASEPAEESGIRITDNKIVIPLDGSVGLNDIEYGVLKRILERCGGNQVKAAQLLGVSRDLLRYRVKKHGL